MAIGNERFRKEMAKRQVKLKAEQEHTKELFDRVVEMGDEALPKPLPEGYVPNAKLEEALKPIREKLAKEQEDAHKFIATIAELSLPTPIEKPEPKKEE